MLGFLTCAKLKETMQNSAIRFEHQITLQNLMFSLTGYTDSLLLCNFKYVVQNITSSLCLSNSQISLTNIFPIIQYNFLLVFKSLVVHFLNIQLTLSTISKFQNIISFFFTFYILLFYCYINIQPIQTIVKLYMEFLILNYLF